MVADEAAGREVSAAVVVSEGVPSMTVSGIGVNLRVAGLSVAVLVRCSIPDFADCRSPSVGFDRAVEQGVAELHRGNRHHDGLFARI